MQLIIIMTTSQLNRFILTNCKRVQVCEKFFGFSRLCGHWIQIQNASVSFNSLMKCVSGQRKMERKKIMANAKKNAHGNQSQNKFEFKSHKKNKLWREREKKTHINAKNTCYVVRCYQCAPPHSASSRTYDFRSVQSQSLLKAPLHTDDGRSQFQYCVSMQFHWTHFEFDEKGKKRNDLIWNALVIGYWNSEIEYVTHKTVKPDILV